MNNFFVKIVGMTILSVFFLLIAIFSAATKATEEWVIWMWMLFFAVGTFITILMVVYDFQFRNDPGKFWNGLSYFFLASAVGFISLLVFMKQTKFVIADVSIPDAPVWMFSSMFSVVLAMFCRRKVARAKTYRRKVMKQKPA